MISYFVRYRGTMPDPLAFVRYYETRHASILRGFGNIRSLVLHQPAEWVDPFQVVPGRTLLLAQMTFDSASELNNALQLNARRLAREDFALFPKFEGEVTHEAMSGKVIF